MIVHVLFFSVLPSLTTCEGFYPVTPSPQGDSLTGKPRETRRPEDQGTRGTGHGIKTGHNSWQRMGMRWISNSVHDPSAREGGDGGRGRMVVEERWW